MDRRVLFLGLMFGLMSVCGTPEPVRGAQAPRSFTSIPRPYFMTPNTPGNLLTEDQSEAIESLSAEQRGLKALQAEGMKAAQLIAHLVPKPSTTSALWSLRGISTQLTEPAAAELQKAHPEVTVEPLPDVELVCDDSPMPVRQADVAAVSAEFVPWNLVVSGAYALSLSRQVTGKGVLISVLAPDVPHSHISLLGRIKHLQKFGPVTHTRTQDDLLLIHPLGIMAGTHPNQLMGIAPDVNIALATLPRGKVSLHDYLNAIQWLMEPAPGQTPAAIFLAVDFSSPAHRLVREQMRACRTAGILPIAPAGNNPDRITGAAALPEVVTVGALDQWKKRALFSGQGPGVVDAVPIPKPDLAEPGVAIFGPSYDSVPFRYGSGTLQAAAHFAGIYALLKEVRPQESPDAFLYALATTSADLGSAGVDMETGMGLPDPNAALYLLENPPETPIPTFYLSKP